MASSKIQLYSLATPNGQKIGIALEEMEIPYEPHLVDIKKGEQFKPEFLAINPNNKIPAIVDPTGAPGLVTHRGSCHCKAVRFEVDAPAELIAWDCNCSICALKRNTHFIVPSSHFRLAPESKPFLSEYRFNTGVARHLFCTVCGVCCHYVPRSNPDGVAVTVFCLEPGTVRRVTVRSFDGRHWEEAYAASGIAAATPSPS